MRDSFDRREVLRVFGAGMIGAATPPWMPRPVHGDDALDRLADRIVRAPRDKVFELVAPMLKAGLPWEELQGALFIAGLKEIEPRPVGNKFHAVLAVESVYQLAADGPPAERGMAILWNLEEIKIAQERDERQGAWTQPASPDVSFSSKAAAARELHAAFAMDDAPRADRAVTGLARLTDRAQLFEALWRYGLREHVGLCHRTIFAVHADRLAARIGDRYTEPIVRSLVHGLFEAPPGDTVAEYEASRRAAATLPADWMAGTHVPQRSLEIARALRDLAPKGARALAVSELKAGRAPRTLWDGLRLAGADLFARRPVLLVVHATTVTNCLFHIFRTTRDETTRALALLQAFAWMPLFRDRFVASRDLDMSRPGLEPILALSSGPSAAELEASVRANLFRSIDQNHQVKYAAAVLEDLHLVDPRWRRALLVPALDYLPGADEAMSELAQRSRALLGRTGR